MKNYILILLIFLLASCSENPKLKLSRNDFIDVLDVKNTPSAARDWNSFCFSDLGSWHGYALPSENDSLNFGAFTGPFLMTEGLWLSTYLSKLQIQNSAGLDMELKDFKSKYYPGKLQQSFTLNSQKIEQELIFITEQTSLIRTKFPLTCKLEQYKIQLNGELLIYDCEIEKVEDGIRISSDKFDGDILIYFPFGLFKDVKVEKNAYTIFLDENAIKNNEIVFIQSYAIKPQLKEDKYYNIYITESKEYFKKNENRWNRYLSDILNVENELSGEFENKKAAVKCIQTLVGNWKVPYKGIKHNGLFPSIGVWYFNGFWAWDSWKHAVALAHFNTEVAQDQIKAMFDYQDKDGMVADCIFADSLENNWRDTKPPLSAWAVWKVYEVSKDKFFLSDIYDQVKIYHYWWYTYRDRDQDGLCEYGSTDGTRIAAAWESGMDNAVRFDHAKMLKNKENAWSLNQESVDLNAYLYAEKMYLMKIAKELSFYFDAKGFENEAALLKEKINSQMYDEKTGFYYDINYESGDFITVMGPEGWIPLWAGISSQEQANEVVKTMMDKTKFNTYVPLLTLQADHPKMDPLDGYWRGPVWLDQVYFGLVGMKNYGFELEANELTNKVYNNIEGFKNSQASIRENYHPLTGEGLNAYHFSWSAAHLLLMYIENESN